MAVFLENLGPSLPSAVEAGSKLSQHIGRIDDYLAKPQTSDSSILNEPEVSQPASEVPIQHFVVPHSNLIPMEYVDDIPWPSSFGANYEDQWSNEFIFHPAHG